MTLKEWIKKKGISQAAFGKKIGKNQSTISKWCNFVHAIDKPSRELIKRITKGEVKL